MAVRFDASSDRVHYTAAAPPDPTAGLTVTLWAYLSVDRDDFSDLIRFWTSPADTTSVILCTMASGDNPRIVSAGNPGGVNPAGHVMVVGGWSRVAVTLTGATATIYVADGATGSVDSGTGSWSGTTPNALTIAGRSVDNSSEWFNGRISHVRIWSGVLTQPQIEDEWMSSEPVETTGLWADWPLLVHTDLTDHSGNGRNLTAGSTAVTTEGDPPIPVPLTPTSVASLAAVGTPGIASITALQPVQMPTSVGLGEPALSVGPVTVTPTGIASQAAVGAPALTALVPKWRLTPPPIVEYWPMPGTNNALRTSTVREVTVFGDEDGLFTSEMGGIPEGGDEYGAIPFGTKYIWYGGHVNTTTDPDIRDLWLAHDFEVEDVTGE